MKVLNLYAGIGGNRKLWEGVEVTAVEKNPQIAEVYASFYPNDEVVIGDAHEYLVKNCKKYDFVWTSPPCQSHSKMMKFTRHDVAKYPDFKLYEEIIFLQNFFKGAFVVENVVPYYTPLVPPTAKLGRHLFWSSFPISPFDLPSPKNFTNLATVPQKKIMMDWLGLHYDKNIYYEGNHCPVQVLRNAVHPLTGKHVFDCLNKRTQPSTLFI